MCMFGGVWQLWGGKYKGVAQLCFTERMAQREPIYKIKSFLSVPRDERVCIIFQIKGTSFHLKSILFLPHKWEHLRLRHCFSVVMLQRKCYTCFSWLTIQLQPHHYCSALRWSWRFTADMEWGKRARCQYRVMKSISWTRQDKHQHAV